MYREEGNQRMEALRNLGRHKLRNALTIGGIVIGVLALTTMGALAEKTNKLFEGGVTFFEDHVTVRDASGTSPFGSRLMRAAKAEEIRRVEGAAAVFPIITVPAKAEQTGFSFGVPSAIIGSDPAYSGYSRFKLSYAQGRALNDTRGEVVLGADFSKELGVKVGDALQLPVPPAEPRPGFRSHEFRVVGILEKTLTAPDSLAYVSVADARMLLSDGLPSGVRDSVDATSLVTGFDVFGTPGTDLDALAARINGQVRDVRAYPPSELVRSFQSASVIFSAITTGSALLALIVGGLSIVNTMSMAVVERFREVGLKKALGARTGHILREFLGESATIGLLGGVIGLALGWALIQAINAATAAQSLELFLLTPRLVLTALAFSVGLGALAGLIPALRASRLDPVTALRYQ